MPRFAANLTMMFNEHPFLDRFQAASDAGFNAVEYLFPYDFPAQEIAARLESAGLKQALFNMPAGVWANGERGLACLEGRRDEFLGAVDDALAYARVIETPMLHMMAGLGDPMDKGTIQRFKEALQIAADKTGEAGVGLVIEPINARDMPGYFLSNFKQALEFVQEIDQPHMRLQFDIYHRQITHGDVITGLREMMPWIGHIQTASVPLRNEPGTGELNDKVIFEEIDRLGYAGYVGCEYRPAGRTTDGLAWLKGV